MALNYVAPAQLATAGSEKKTGLMQGAALPNITTTSGTATSVPQWYMDAIQQIGTEAAKTAQGANFVGPTDLQNKAYKSALNLNAGSGLSNALGNLNQQNIATSLAPNAVAGIAGSGQFGSSRGAGALGGVISNANIATQAQQAQANHQDYQNYLNQINTQNTLGKEKQSILQNQQLFPMQQLTNEAALLKGLTVPTSTSSTYTGPVPGAYSASPLAQIAGLGSLTAGAAQLIPSLGKALGGTNLPQMGSDLWKFITGGSSGSNSSGSNDNAAPTNNTAAGTTVADGQLQGTTTINGVTYNAMGDPVSDPNFNYNRTNPLIDQAYSNNLNNDANNYYSNNNYSDNSNYA